MPAAEGPASGSGSSGKATGGRPAVTRPAEGTLAGAFRWASWCAGGAVALVALLYVTNWFEHLLDGASHGLTSNGSPLAGALAGATAGALHTLAGPDHLAGLAPLVVGRRRSTIRALGLGTLWGSGHATGQVLVGLFCLAVQRGLLRGSVASALGQFSSLLVGLSLVAIGLLGFYEGRHADEAALEAASHGESSTFGWATFGTGVLHGLQPDAIIFVAPALALPRKAAAAFIAAFGAGTLLSMATYTAALGALCGRSPRLRQISATASTMAILLGVSLSLASFGISVPLPGL